VRGNNEGLNGKKTILELMSFSSIINFKDFNFSKFEKLNNE
jgi:hypothetical protein